MRTWDESERRDDQVSSGDLEHAMPRSTRASAVEVDLLQDLQSKVGAQMTRKMDLETYDALIQVDAVETAGCETVSFTWNLVHARNVEQEPAHASADEDLHMAPLAEIRQELWREGSDIQSLARCSANPSHRGDAPSCSRPVAAASPRRVQAKPRWDSPSSRAAAPRSPRWAGASCPPSRSTQIQGRAQAFFGLPLSVQ